MRVAIVHYHLRRGGVTRVIGHAVRALPGSVHPAVLCGEPAAADSGGLPCPIRVVDGLGYDAPAPTRDPAALAAALTEAARNVLGGAPDLWHIHNHSLGKCAALPGAANHLARDGHRLLLQVHDLPEDGRPANYAHLAAYGSGPLYPAAPHVHYAVLNARDGAFLRQAGLPADRLHDLPNAVWVAGGDEADPGPAGDLLVYPTRAIRRKNLGEFLYWAAGAEPGQRFAVTLAPRNPAARAVYDRWVHLSRDLGLPVAFEVGAGASRRFADIVRSARAAVTTSVAEGFGLAFLEPWLLGRPVVGRDLPEITGAFTGAGIRLDGLYARCEVPLDEVDLPGLRERLEHALRATGAAYRRPPPEGAGDRALASMIRNGRIDFGRLDEEEQERILRRAVPARALRADVSAATVADNARVIAGRYGLDRYGERLHAVYRQAAGSPTGPVTALSAPALLDAFLDPSRFNLLRTGG